MASPYILTNHDLQFTNAARQTYRVFFAFFNPVSITTNWQDLGQDVHDQWLPPVDTDTAALKIQPYAPTANLGSNRIGFVGEMLHFDGSRSCQRHDLPVLSYAWSVSGPGSITSYANNSQVGVVWSAPGLYTITLTVTDKAGTQTHGTRQVMIYQDRQHALPGMISLSGLSGGLSNGGWQCQLTTVNSQMTLLPPESLLTGTYLPIVIMIETAYEIVPGQLIWRTIGAHGQFNPGAPYMDPRIFFDGYIVNGTVQQDVEKDTLSFSCSGPQMILQESHAHLTGYYNTSYTSVVNGVPQGCKSSPVGKGTLVGNLTTADVIHSLLQVHTNLFTYHDLHIWNAIYPTAEYLPSSPVAYYLLIYTTLSLTEGTLWDNLSTLCTNEWAVAHFERDGSLRIGPQVNYRGSDFWATPTLLGATAAPALVNVLSDLGYTVPGDLTTMPSNLPTLPAQPIPITFTHPWGHQPNPPQHGVPYQSFIDPEITSTQSALNGPPVLCSFSDVPDYDIGATPPAQLLPQVAAQWPQQLSVYYVSLNVPQGYTGHTALVKLIGTLYGHTTLWTCWYPQNTFSVAHDGTATTVTNVLPAGNWVLDESHLLPDVTTKQNGLLVSNYWWELARRHYYQLNNRYTASVVLGMFTPAQLGDLVQVTRQNISLGPRWLKKYFYVTQIDYSLDLSGLTWATTIQLAEVSSILFGPIQPPPKIVPRGYTTT